ncbi:MAG: DUF3343 domain-containing protein [Actinobacteria bacterium]|nr:DUF3343 domain-containing protein [Actinomycetota bacterium]
MDIKNKGKCIVLFHSTSSAIKAEKVVKSAGLKVSLIPIPRHLSSDCGICLCFEPRLKHKIEELLKSNKVDYESIEEI